MLSWFLVAPRVGTSQASGIGAVLVSFDRFSFCEAEVQEENLACTPPLSSSDVRRCWLATG